MEIIEALIAAVIEWGYEEREWLLSVLIVIALVIFAFCIFVE